MISTEARVGAFVLAGLALFAVAIFLLGDFTFEKRYILYVTFQDVAGLPDKAPVKLSGVEIGKVSAITLEGPKARVHATIRRDVPIYRDAVFTIGATGIIGSKFLQVEQGRPSSGAWPPGSVVLGSNPVSIEKALSRTLESLQELLQGLNGEGTRKGALAKNINATVENVRRLTTNLDEIVTESKPQLTKALGRMDGISEKMDALLARADRIMASIENGKGPVGALINDEKMKADVQETVASLKETAGNVKDMVGRINQFKVYWNYDWRYEHALQGSRTDLGLRIEPREGRYYYLGGANLGNVSDASRGNDYAKKNTVDALLGWRWPRVDLGVGLLRSGGGARVSVTPLPEHPLLGRVSLVAQGYDFGRNRTVSGRLMDHPQYDVGLMARVNRLVGVGARVEDVQEVARAQTWVNVSFEDKDVAYLFGLVSFGTAGTKGRSKSK